MILQRFGNSIIYLVYKKENRLVFVAISYLIIMKCQRVMRMYQHNPVPRVRFPFFMHTTIDGRSRKAHTVTRWHLDACLSLTVS